jgi:hypothetical protein
MLATQLRIRQLPRHPLLQDAGDLLICKLALLQGQLPGLMPCFSCWSLSFSCLGIWGADHWIDKQIEFKTHGQGVLAKLTELGMSTTSLDKTASLTSE